MHTLAGSQNGADSTPAAQPATDDAKAVRIDQNSLRHVPHRYQAEAAPADAKQEEPPKSPSILHKILSPFKKAPKSPKEKKKEEAKVREGLRVKSLADISSYFRLMLPRLKSLARPNLLLGLMLPKLRKLRLRL
jgi:hypothetical protein